MAWIYVTYDSEQTITTANTNYLYRANITDMQSSAYVQCEKMLQMLRNPVIMVNVIKKNKSFRMIYHIQQKEKNMQLSHWTTKLLGKLDLFDVADVKFSILMKNHKYIPPSPLRQCWVAAKKTPDQRLHILRYNIDMEGEGEAEGGLYIDCYKEDANWHIKNASFARIPNEFCRPVSELWKCRDK